MLPLHGLPRMKVDFSNSSTLFKPPPSVQNTVRVAATGAGARGPKLTKNFDVPFFENHFWAISRQSSTIWIGLILIPHKHYYSNEKTKICSPKTPFQGLADLVRSAKCEGFVLANIEVPALDFMRRLPSPEPPSPVSKVSRSIWRHVQAGRRSNGSKHYTTLYNNIIKEKYTSVRGFQYIRNQQLS